MQARFVALAVVGSLLHLTFALPARAQDSAAECFRQGYELSRSHKYREAIPYYTKTIERDGSNSGDIVIEDTPGTPSASTTRPWLISTKPCGSIPKTPTPATTAA